MKKQFLLLISLLLPLISGCGEKPIIEPTIKPTVEPTEEPSVEITTESTSEIVYNYKESEYTTLLNTIDFRYEGLGDPKPDEVIVGNFIHENHHSLISFSGEKNDEYYLCAYIHKDDLEFMNYYIENEEPLLSYPLFYDNDYSMFRGIKGTLIKMSIFNKVESVKSLYPNYIFKEIKWYEIPRGEEIPMNIEEYNLSYISEIFYFDYYDLSQNYIGRKPFLLECINHEIYQDLKAHSERTIKRYELYIDYIYTNRFFIHSKEYSQELGNPYQLSRLLMFYKNYRYMEDGIDYFILYGLSVAEYNLNEYYQLIEGTGYDEYLIRFDDFIDFLRIIKSY